MLADYIHLSAAAAAAIGIDQVKMKKEVERTRWRFRCESGIDRRDTGGTPRGYHPTRFANRSLRSTRNRYIAIFHHIIFLARSQRFRLFQLFPLSVSS